MDKKKIIKFSFILLLIIILWGCVWAWFVTKTVRKNASNNTLKNQHAIVKNIIVTETQEEKKHWEFYAKSGEYNSEHNSVLLNDVIGNFYDKNGEVVVSFQSSKGTYDEKSKKMILDGENLFVGKNGARLHADKLIWQGREEDILAEGNVQFIQENKLVTKSNKAVFNSSLTNFKIMESAKVKIYGDESTKKKYAQL